MLKPEPNFNQSKNCIELDALGTHWWVEIFGDHELPIVEAAVRGCVQGFEQDYSRFRDDSFVGKLNQKGSLRNPPEEMLRMMQFAHSIHTATRGIFNISVGGALVSAGYGKGKSNNIKLDFWAQTELTPNKITIPNETQIDFGGFGKGWLIDKLAKALRDLGVRHFIINGGGDIFVDAASPIEFALEHPYDPSQQIGSTSLQNGALAVSSIVKRTWRDENGQPHHHIIDTRTGESSSNDIICSFVRAESALIADTMATVLIIDPTQNKKLSSEFKLKTILLSASQLEAK